MSNSMYGWWETNEKNKVNSTNLFLKLLLKIKNIVLELFENENNLENFTAVLIFRSWFLKISGKTVTLLTLLRRKILIRDTPNYFLTHETAFIWDTIQ